MAYPHYINYPVDTLGLQVFLSAQLLLQTQFTVALQNFIWSMLGVLSIHLHSFSLTLGLHVFGSTSMSMRKDPYCSLIVTFVLSLLCRQWSYCPLQAFWKQRFCWEMFPSSLAWAKCQPYVSFITWVMLWLSPSNACLSPRKVASSACVHHPASAAPVEQRAKVLDLKMLQKLCFFSVLTVKLSALLQTRKFSSCI